MATHFSVLAWRIPGTGEPGGLPSMGSHRVGQDCSDLAVAAVPTAFISIAARVESVERRWQGSWLRPRLVAPMTAPQSEAKGQALD